MLSHCTIFLYRVIKRTKSYQKSQGVQALVKAANAKPVLVVVVITAFAVQKSRVQL